MTTLLPHLEKLLAAASTDTAEAMASFPLPHRVEHVRHMQHDIYDADGENIGNFAFRAPSELYVAAVNALPALLHLARAAEAWRNNDLSRFGEPKASDYCVQCGDSPDSGSHLPHGHAYVDPRPAQWLRAAIDALLAEVA